MSTNGTWKKQGAWDTDEYKINDKKVYVSEDSLGVT